MPRYAKSEMPILNGFASGETPLSTHRGIRRGPYRPSRRTFLTVCGLTLEEILRGNIGAAAGETRDKVRPVVLLWLEGAASPWETFMPLKPEAQEEYKGKNPEAVATRISGIRLGKVLPKVAQVLHHGTLIRSVDAETHDHFISTQNLLIEGNKLGNPTLGEVIGRKGAAGGAPYTVLNMPGHYANDPPTIRDHRMGSSFRFDLDMATLRLKKPEIRKDPRLDDRRELLHKLDTKLGGLPATLSRDTSLDTAFGMLGGDSKYFDAFDLPEKEIERFGKLRDTFNIGGKNVEIPNPLAPAAAAANFMVTKGGAGFVTIHHCEREGWDMHANMEQEMNILGSHLDAALRELILRARAEGYVVICTSEMGRTPKLNGAISRDHDNVHFFYGAGGKFNQGAVIGDCCKQGRISKDRVKNTELFPTVLRAAGMDVAETIPRVKEATT